MTRCQGSNGSYFCPAAFVFETLEHVNLLLVLCSSDSCILRFVSDLELVGWSVKDSFSDESY